MLPLRTHEALVRLNGQAMTAFGAATSQNLTAILAQAGCTLDDVVKTTVFLSDIADFAAMNEVYARHFKAQCPARSAVEVANLPKNAMVEIEAIAAYSQK